MRKVLIILAILLIIPNLALAQTINSKGSSGAPVSVSTAATVLDFRAGRKGWCIEPETSAVRCEPSSSSAAPATTPTSSVGFYFPSGTITCHNNLPNNALTTPIQWIRLDCASTGGTTSVDSWEE